MYMKTRTEIETAYRSEAATITGYRKVPKGWTIEELRQAARDGHVKLVPGRHLFKPGTPRELGYAWRLIQK